MEGINKNFVELMGNNRETWVDIAKGFSIIAVVFGHLGFVDPKWPLLPVRTLFAELWHVTNFFLIAGFFLKDSMLIKPISFVKAKFKNLYLLILYIYIPILLLHNVFIDIGFYDLATDYSGRYVSYWSAGDLFKNIIMSVAFAGREQLLGAMWFVYVLFLSLCVLSLVSFVSEKISTDGTHSYEQVRFAILIIFAVVSCTFSNVLGNNIPRFNNVFTAVFLIYVGMMIKQHYKVKFDNGFVAGICALIIWHIATTKGNVSIAANVIPNVISLLGSSCAALYVTCYLSKKISKNVVWGGVISYIGRESFYIMGLHFIGFKLCTLLLRVMGMDLNLAQLKAPVGDNYWLIPVYVVFSIAFPLSVIFIVRITKKAVRYCRIKKDWKK